MAIINLKDLRARLGRNERLIGLDPGTKTIGVALSDVTLMLASPYGSLKRGKLAANAAEIAAIAKKEGAAGLVVGLPLSMDGSMGPAAQAAIARPASQPTPKAPPASFSGSGSVPPVPPEPVPAQASTPALSMVTTGQAGAW